tara:strand:- start:972 stop:1157 length:186 start_codon:yes stop_codon:yes gene_type:complete
MIKVQLPHEFILFTTKIKYTLQFLSNKIKKINLKYSLNDFKENFKNDIKIRESIYGFELIN